MNFVKGMFIGGALVAGATILYAETSKKDKKNLMKQGKKFMKNIKMM